MALHQRVAAERKLAGLSVRQCARAAGWNDTLWLRMEDGTRPIYGDHLPVIAKILGTTVARLFGEQPFLVPHYKRRGRKPRHMTIASQPPHIEQDNSSGRKHHRT